MAFEYLPGNSLMHRLDPRIKLLWLGSNIVLGALLFDPMLLALVYANVVFLIIASKIPWNKLSGMYKGLVPVCIFYFLANLWYYVGPTKFVQLLPSSVLNGYVISLEGIVFSLGVIARFILMVTAYRLLTLTTTISDYVLGLVKLKLPKEFGVALSIGFAYVPVLVTQVANIMDAQRSRGWVFEYRNPLRRVRAMLPTLFPVIMTSIRRGYQIAAAIESKGFGNISRRTYMHQLKFKGLDYWAALVCFAAMAVGYYIQINTPTPGIIYTLNILYGLMGIKP
jgi:energy-coupling factor transport system permease protein